MLFQDGRSDARGTDVAGIAERPFRRSACFVDAGVRLRGEGVEACCCRGEVSPEDVGDGDVRLAGLRGDGGGQDGRHGWSGYMGARWVVEM